MRPHATLQGEIVNLDQLWDGLVPGAWVHRTQLPEVLITGVAVDGESRFTAGAQWPRRHPYFGPRDADSVPVDVAIAAETLRQATIAVFHRFLGVPTGHAFIMEALRIRVFDAMRTAAAPQNVRVTIELLDCVTRHGITVEAKSSVRMFLDGALVAHGRGDARVLPPAVFRRLRSGAVTSSATSSPARWDPCAGGGPEFAVVERDGGRMTLRADTGNPVYFDHPLDHVPGMVVLEGCRQAARLWLQDATVDIEAITLTFARHLELNETTTIVMRSTGSTTLSVEFLQNAESCAAGTLRIRDRFTAGPRLKPQLTDVTSGVRAR